MIVDSSALIAIVTGESDGARFLDAVIDAEQVAIGTPTLLVCAMVLIRRRSTELAELHQFVRLALIEVLPFGAEHLTVSQDAARRYGRGSGHPAALNFGDCFAYATAIVSGRPLLFKGDDFIHTDVTPALR